jgi:hypothetical protein
MNDRSHKTSSFGVFGWTNYSPVGLAFLGIVTLFPQARKAVGYIILALIVLSASLIIVASSLGSTASELGTVALLSLVVAALLFFPFWLPAVVLGWLGRKAIHRIAEIADESLDDIEDHHLERRQLYVTHRQRVALNGNDQ